MHGSRSAVPLVVAVVLATTLVSGPLVGAVDLTSASEPSPFGGGSVTVDDVSLPGEATLAPARFGAAGYYLRVPPATIRLGSVSGTPRLSYRIEISGLAYSRSSVYVPDSAGDYSLSIDRARFDDGEVSAESYDATISVLYRANQSQREIASRPITVEVVE